MRRFSAIVLGLSSAAFLWGVLHAPSAAGVSQGMMGAVKKRVDKLDKKVREQPQPASGTSATTLVVGQPDMTSDAANQGGAAAAKTLSMPLGVSSNGTKLFIADFSNNRVLIYNAIPAADNASANVVVGQINMAATLLNQGNGNLNPGPNTLSEPQGVFSDGVRLYVADTENNRALIYSAIPAANNASANVVVGQPDMLSSVPNPGGVASNTLSQPYGIFASGTRLFIADSVNNRVLIYDPSP